MPSKAPAIVEQSPTKTDNNQNNSNGFSLPIQVIESPEAEASRHARERDSDKHDAADLEAQRKAADAAERSAIATEWQKIPTIVQIVLAAIGTLGFIISLILGVISTRAAVRSTKLIATIERAYVFVAVKLISVLHRANTTEYEVTFQVKLRNHGKTPAVIKRLRVYAVLLNHYPDSLEDAPVVQDLPPGKVIGASKLVVKELSIAFDLQDWPSVLNGSFKLLCLGEISYLDIHQDEQRTGFCWEMLTKDGKHFFDIAPSEKLNYRT